MLQIVVIDDQINDIITTIPKCNVVKVDPIIGFDNVDKVLDILL
jgi:hypothetical protein